MLLARRLSSERSALLLDPDRPIEGAILEGYRSDLAKRAGRYPLQYITGRQEFYSLELEIDERVLIPRPETEMLVDEVLRLTGSAGDMSPSVTVRRRTGSGSITAATATEQESTVSGPLIVDVGTGSGCIAIALAVNLEKCTILATDISGDALDVARRNAARHGVEGKVSFERGDGLTPALEKGLAGRVDFVVSNPPYIAGSDLEGLQPELRHEPRLALSPGESGLELTARILEDAAPTLRPGGWLLIELSAGRSEEARELLDRSLWEEIETRPDVQGIPRILVARRRKS